MVIIQLLMLPGGPFYSWRPGLTSVIDMWDLINMAPSYSLSLAAGGGRVISSALPPSSRWWTGCRDQPPVTITSYMLYTCTVYCAPHCTPSHSIIGNILLRECRDFLRVSRTEHFKTFSRFLFKNDTNDTFKRGLLYKIFGYIDISVHLSLWWT